MTARSPHEDLYHNLSHYGPSENPFQEPALPQPVRQATHPALQAARAAATANNAGRPVLLTSGPAMPSAASGAHGTISPSSYAQQFQTPTSFSDAPRKQQRHSKKPSLFRRSVVALTGGNRASVVGQPPANNLSRKPSALRKSMAWLLGPPPPVRLAPGIGDTPSTAVEKEVAGQAGKDPFLGGGGEGNEWDVDGSGASFWKRFSVAQRHAQNLGDPLTQKSKEYVEKQKRANRKMRWGVYLSLVLLVALIVGLAVGIPTAQHSNQSSSDSGSDTSSNSKRALVSPSDFPVASDKGLHVAGGADIAVSTSAVEASWNDPGSSTLPTLSTKRSLGRTHHKLAQRRAVAQAAVQA